MTWNGVSIAAKFLNSICFVVFFLLTEEWGISTQNVKKPVISGGKWWLVDSAQAIDDAIDWQVNGGRGNDPLTDW